MPPVTAPRRGTRRQSKTETIEELESSSSVDAPRVGIIMGSKSDLPAMQKAADELEERGILFEVRVVSAHRDPDVVAAYARNAKMRGLRVIIAGAGLAAALPGVVAAHTDLPVIGVPLTSKIPSPAASTRCSRSPRCRRASRSLRGLDNASNAAVLAARILNA